MNKVLAHTEYYFVHSLANRNSHRWMMPSPLQERRIHLRLHMEWTSVNVHLSQPSCRAQKSCNGTAIPCAGDTPNLAPTSPLRILMWYACRTHTASLVSSNFPASQASTARVARKQPEFEAKVVDSERLPCQVKLFAGSGRCVNRRLVH